MARRKRFERITIRQDHWEPHETVEIKALNEEETEWVQDLSVILKNSPTTQTEPELHVLSGSSRRAQMIRSIVSWTLTGEQGEPMPWPQLFDGFGNIIQDNLIMRSRMIGTLAPEDAAFIETEINKLNKPMSEQEKKGLSMNATPGSSENVTPFHQPLSIVN